MKKGTLALIAITVLGAGVGFNLLNPTTANAKSKYTAQERRIIQLKWRHPYDGNDDITVYDSKGKIIKTFSGQGFNQEHYKNNLRMSHVPKLIRGRWYLSAKKHISINKKRLTQKPAVDKNFADPSNKHFNLNKQRYNSSYLTYLTYYRHPRNTRKTYSFSAYNPLVNGYTAISTDMLPFKMKTSSGKTYSALAIEDYQYRNRVTYKIAYHKHHAKLPHRMALVYYGDIFGTWPSNTSQKLLFGKTVSESAIRAETRLSLAHQDGIVNLGGGGDQAIQYATKVDKMKLSPEIIATLLQ